MPFVCGDHATVLLLQGSPVPSLRRNNSDAAFTHKDFVFMFCACMSGVFFFVVVVVVVVFCMLYAGQLQTNGNLNDNLIT